MKKGNLINEEVSQIVASIGHGQSLVVVDAGYPIPSNARKVDLAVSPGVPSFEDVLTSILSELEVEEYVTASEAQQDNQRVLTFLAKNLPEVTHTEEPHAEFRETVQKDRRNSTAKAFIRTGDTSSYGSVALVGGWLGTFEAGHLPAE